MHFNDMIVFKERQIQMSYGEIFRKVALHANSLRSESLEAPAFILKLTEFLWKRKDFF